MPPETSGGGRRLRATHGGCLRRPWSRRLALVAWSLLAASDGVRANDFQGATHLMPFDEDTLRYSRTEATGPVARLQRRLERGEVSLRHDTRHGYLPALLDALGVPTSSQMLVFSKTSFQRERISPATPRALYFNDDVYVGYVAGSPLLEISMQDPKLGGVFYTLEQEKTDRPKLVRTDQCLECHASAKSLGVPGHLVRSFATDEQGAVDLASGTSLVTHRTPLEDRWGGWYVTGHHGGQTHRGNLFGKAAFAQQDRSPNYLGNLTDLGGFFDTNQTPAAGSDIVALMVLEHQAHMNNFITRLHYESALALASYGHLRYLKNQMDAFLRYLLFVEEAPLTAPIRGASGFQEHFESLGPKDPKGRSLRQFDLRTRLFKYPCSYLIYSEAFDALPGPVKTALYERLLDILTGTDASPAWAKLSPQTRSDILEILRATQRGLPEDWQQRSKAQRSTSSTPAK